MSGHWPPHDKECGGQSSTLSFWQLFSVPRGQELAGWQSHLALCVSHRDRPVVCKCAQELCVGQAWSESLHLPWTGHLVVVGAVRPVRWTAGCSQSQGQTARLGPVQCPGRTVVVPSLFILLGMSETDLCCLGVGNGTPAWVLWLLRIGGHD